MKRISLTTRLSLWFTLILTLICILLVSAGAAVYATYDQHLARMTLMDAVEAAAEKLDDGHGFADRMEAGELRESEFLDEDVRLMVYDEDGEHVAGLFLYAELDEVECQEMDHAKKVKLNGESYYYYDLLVKVKRGKDYWVRGVVRAERSLLEELQDHIGIVLMVPVLLLLAFLGGRWLTGYFLRPIRSMDETAKDIRKSGDLSRRIAYEETGDELSELAGHMNGMLDRLEKNFDAERQFVSNASHELRTPVSVILAQCEYGLENAKDEEELREVITAVQKQGGRMSRLIETLLLFTRMEQSTERYRREETDLAALVRSACADHALINERGMTIRHTEPEQLSAVVNQELYRLLLDNLLVNAARYGKENGRIDVSLEEKDGKAVLTVSDDGAGISAEDLPHIFEMFYRADRSRSTKGLGLGLPLVKQIAAYHGGTVSVQSTEGSGTAFTVEIPLSTE